MATATKVVKLGNRAILGKIAKEMGLSYKLRLTWGLKCKFKVEGGLFRLIQFAQLTEHIK